MTAGSVCDSTALATTAFVAGSRSAKSDGRLVSAELSVSWNVSPDWVPSGTFQSMSVVS